MLPLSHTRNHYSILTPPFYFPFERCLALGPGKLLGESRDSPTHTIPVPKLCKMNPCEAPPISQLL